ncbi:Amino acid transporter [Abditibacterium utsteinense]|uniref:Amino acid transporter n=1 Tax=Abditibacterium utsteinense TaxID=1960156 RepID=A0A2S8SRL9_9BACT|nr:amino acid transporter [Abditibacterium utsteinense]PQV63462.1 Amino acid transporter [Abditibacterium utsteinense]
MSDSASPAAPHEAPYAQEGAHKPHSWWQVLCLTGVDYFSTLGYQPGIAALAAGALAPLATFILILLTLFGAVPVYARVAQESPHGEGSVAMLERLLAGWKGKVFVLVLLGFAATDFVITITLSAADATAHIIENPYAPHFAHDHRIGITLLLIGLLGAVFYKGFKEAIGIAVGLTVVYLSLNTVVLGVAINHIFHHPEYLPRWKESLFAQASSPWSMLGYSLLIFPKLALGLSGFETGVAVMPLIKSEDGTLQRRIKNTKKLLLWAALIMSVFLMASSFATTLAIPAAEFQKGGRANGRALAYLAHSYLGDGFGTVYDVSTILILWFAGASALAALLNLVPRYLPRYGMAPEWARASRPLAVVFTLVAFFVTLLFKADVDAQGGAYATGVLVLITSAATAATLSALRQKQSKMVPFFGAVALIFLYTTVQNIHERPEGIKIAGVFILSIVIISFLSRVSRTTELRVEGVELDEVAQRFVNESCGRGLRVIANKRQAGDAREYALKEDRQREDSHIPASLPILFLEVEVNDASDFASALQVHGVEVEGYRILRMESSTVPNAIAALLLHMREATGKRPHAYFNWSEGNPLAFMMRYLLLGEGDTAPLTREVLRKAEKNPEKRPMIHVDG